MMAFPIESKFDSLWKQIREMNRSMVSHLPHEEDVATLLRAKFGPPKTGFAEFVNERVVLRRKLADENQETRRISRACPPKLAEMSFDDNLFVIRNLGRYSAKVSLKDRREKHMWNRRKVRLTRKHIGIKAYIAMRNAGLQAISPNKARGEER